MSRRIRYPISEVISLVARGTLSPGPLGAKQPPHPTSGTLAHGRSREGRPGRQGRCRSALRAISSKACTVGCLSFTSICTEPPAQNHQLLRSWCPVCPVLVVFALAKRGLRSAVCVCWGSPTDPASSWAAWVMAAAALCLLWCLLSIPNRLPTPPLPKRPAAKIQPWGGTGPAVTTARGPPKSPALVSVTRPC